MKKVLFIDRDGTIIAEPPDEQIDSFEKLTFLPGAITNLACIASQLDFALVLVTNQDGLGTDSFPEETFWPVQNLMLRILESEGIIFDDICIDIGDFAESIAEMVEEAVTHMDIELHDLDPNDLDDDYDFDDEEDLEDLIDDIEDKYDSRVENIDRLKIKIREDYVKMELDATLENGKKVDKIKIYAH